MDTPHEDLNKENLHSHTCRARRKFLLMRTTGVGLRIPVLGPPARACMVLLPLAGLQLNRSVMVLVYRPPRQKKNFFTTPHSEL